MSLPPDNNALPTMSTQPTRMGECQARPIHAQCAVCLRSLCVDKAGLIHPHGRIINRCLGSSKPPANCIAETVPSSALPAPPDVAALPGLSS